MSQSGIISDLTSPFGDVEFLTGNAGGAVGPDATFNINILGSNVQGINIVGVPATNTLTVSGIDATTAQKGVAELATDAETIAGAATTVTVTPASLAAKLGTQTQYAIPIGETAAGAFGWTNALTNGQLVIGSTGANPVAAALQPGTGIGITLGAGTCTVSSTGMGMSWSTVGASTALINNNGFICTAGAALSFSLPAVAAVGTAIGLSLDGSTSWTITQGAGQQIRIGNQQTTLGAGGSLASTDQGDTVLLMCVTANTRWIAIDVVGNITVV